MTCLPNSTRVENEVNKLKGNQKGNFAENLKIRIFNKEKHHNAPL